MACDALVLMFVAKSHACSFVTLREQNFLSHAPFCLTTAVQDVCVNAIAAAIKLHVTGLD
jgi:hypothetical protein